MITWNISNVHNTTSDCSRESSAASIIAQMCDSTNSGCFFIRSSNKVRGNFQTLIYSRTKYKKILQKWNPVEPFQKRQWLRISPVSHKWVFLLLLPLPAQLPSRPGFPSQVFHWWTCSINLTAHPPPTLKPEPQPTTQSVFCKFSWVLEDSVARSFNRKVKNIIF